MLNRNCAGREQSLLPLPDFSRKIEWDSARRVVAQRLVSVFCNLSFLRTSRYRRSITPAVNRSILIILVKHSTQPKHSDSPLAFVWTIVCKKPWQWDYKKGELPLERKQPKQVTRRGPLIREFIFQFNVKCELLDFWVNVKNFLELPVTGEQSQYFLGLRGLEKS